MERLGPQVDGGISTVLPALPGPVTGFYRPPALAFIDITNLDRVRYCLGANDHTPVGVSTYFAPDPYSTAEQDAFSRQLVAHGLANFEIITNIRELPGACHFHIHPPSFSYGIE